MFNRNKSIVEMMMKEEMSLDILWRLIRYSNLLFLFLLILFLFHLFIVKEQVTNDFAIVKSTKQYANLTNNPTPFAIIQFKGIDYG